MSSSFLAPFVGAFSQEIGRFGFQPLLVLAQAGNMRGIPSGTDETIRLAHRLGNRYCGAVVIGLDEHVPDFKGAVGRLCGLRRPVVFFDYANRYADYNRWTFGGKRYYHRFFADEKAAVSLALRTLAERGHRAVGMPHYDTRYEFTWISRRIQIMRDCIVREDLPLELVTTQQREKFWRFLPLFSPEEFLLEFKRQVYGKSNAEIDDHELAAGLIRNTPSLVSLLSDRRITAIIAPNDDMALAYFCWLNMVGIKVPDEISLISFDNKMESQFLPITTIDFGFANLGYRAAHIFINDLPIRTGRHGDLGGLCMLMDRGSVGRPAIRRPLRLEKLIRRLEANS